jgi:hypothetical protein
LEVTLKSTTFVKILTKPMAKSNNINPIIKKNKRRRRIRNLGLFMLFFGFIFIVIGCSYYVFRDTPLEDELVKQSETVQAIFFRWLPRTGLVLLIIGIWLVSKWD